MPCIEHTYEEGNIDTVPGLYAGKTLPTTVQITAIAYEQSSGNSRKNAHQYLRLLCDNAFLRSSYYPYSLLAKNGGWSRG